MWKLASRADSIIRHGKNNCALHKETDRYMIFKCEDGFKGSEKSTLLEPGKEIFSVRRDVGPKKTKKVIKDIGGFKRYIKSGDNVFLKIAFSEIAPAPDPKITERIVKEVRKLGAEVSILDNDTPEKDFNTRLISESGYYKMIKKQEIPVYNAKDLEQVKFDKGGHYFSLPLTLLDNNSKLINIATLKHDLVSGVSLGQKNLLDLVSTDDHYNFDIDDLISTVHKIISPTITIIDGSNPCLSSYPLFCEEGESDFIIASNNAVCADSWGARLLFSPIDKIGHIKKSESMGAGNTRCHRAKKSTNPLEVTNKNWKGKNPTTELIENFSAARTLLGRSIGAQMADSFWRGAIIPILNKSRSKK